MTPHTLLDALRPADAGGSRTPGRLQGWRIWVLAWLAVLLLLQSVGQLHRIQHWNLLDDAVAASAHIRASHETGSAGQEASAPDHAGPESAPAGWLAWLWGDHHQAACELLDALSGQSWLVDHLALPMLPAQAIEAFMRLPDWVAPVWARHVPHSPRGPPSAS